MSFPVFLRQKIILRQKGVTASHTTASTSYLARKTGVVCLVPWGMLLAGSGKHPAKTSQRHPPNFGASGAKLAANRVDASPCLAKLGATLLGASRSEQRFIASNRFQKSKVCHANKLYLKFPDVFKILKLLLHRLGIW